MKKFVTVLIVMMFIGSVADAQGWRQVFEKTYPAISDVCLVDANLAYAVTSRDLVDDYALILKSTDGGLSWLETKHITADQSLYSVYFVDANIGFIGGEDESIYKTTDGGGSWTPLTVAGISGDVDEIFFVDANTGWALVGSTSGGQIAKTVDGGVNWNIDLTATKDLLDFSFFDANHGITTGKDGNTIYYTTDGTNWTQATGPNFGSVMYTRSDIYGCTMINQTTAYGVGWGSRAVGLQPTINIKSTDGGASWEYMVQPENQRQHANFYDVIFKDDMTGLTFGGASLEGTIVMKTTDGGVNWYEVPAPYGVTPKALDFVGDLVLGVGGGGLIIRSTDFGDSWEMITEIPSSTLYSLQKVTDNFFISAGFDGAFYRSTDAGLTWSANFADVNNICPTIQEVFFVNENVGYAARNYGMVSKTTDGGVTWFEAKKDTSDLFQTNYGLHFVDENYGFVVGRVASGTDVVYKTIDGGTTWSMQFNQFFDDLRDVFFTDQNNGVVVGDGLIISYTTDGGTTWNDPVLNNIPGNFSTADLNNLTFFDSNFGLATGEIVLKTTDAGKSWDYVEIAGNDKELKTSSIFDLNTWYSAGSDKIYYTSDGGASWTDLADPNVITSSQLYAVFTDAQGFAWVSGSDANVYSNSPLVSVETDNIISFDFDLKQNYPNPFNPNTLITYSLDKESTVCLTIYDLLGNKIKVLESGMKNAGKHEINFDASDLSSGVYFYSLNVNGKTISKKMTLLK